MMKSMGVRDNLDEDELEVLFVFNCSVSFFLLSLVLYINTVYTVGSAINAKALNALH